MPTPLSTKGYDFGRLSYETIGACIEVQRQLGVHCMEVDYQRALELALPKRGLKFQREVEIPITFDGVVITKRRVDFVVSCLSWSKRHRQALGQIARLIDVAAPAHGQDGRDQGASVEIPFAQSA